MAVADLLGAGAPGKKIKKICFIRYMSSLYSQINSHIVKKIKTICFIRYMSSLYGQIVI
jgi:hypothetical protein